MSGKKETYVYGSLKERFALEWKIYALAFGFILIADNIGQIKIPVGKGCKGADCRFNGRPSERAAFCGMQLFWGY